MKNKKFFILALTTLCSISILSSCSSDNDGGGSSTSNGNYIVVAAEDGANYLLQTHSFESGSINTNDGVEAESSTAYVFYKNKYLYRLVYNQGSAGTGSSYMLNADGSLVERNIKFEIRNRFTTYGPYGKYIIAAASGATTYKDDGNDLPKYGVTFTYLDTEDQTQYTKTIVTENYAGNTGEYFTVSGIVEANGKLYTALCPEGVSPYGVSLSWPVQDQTLVGTNGNISGTQHPDNVWVAIFDDITFENPTILHDTRISFATSRYRSQYYQTIVPDANGNVYVFSASNAQGNTGIQQTTKESGVLRINSGATEFDQSYYASLEDLSGGCRMFKVWHITEDYFLLQMYAEPGTGSAMNSDLRRLAIFKGSTTEFRWVDNGLPARETIESFGSTPYAENGKIYMPIVTTDAKPSIYIIDPLTASAVKGMTVSADNGIAALGKLM